ncbi:MAG TPA: NUDIX domain-containing protein [Chlamydiales bacterium]|nr:NUDIX domain-containing protein [Chlamydiales bacterium]
MAFSNLSQVRVGVAAIVRKEGNILLGKRTGSHGEGLWAFPGGHLEFGETVFSCVERELQEEVGIKPLSIKLGPWVENMMEKDSKHYITIFACVDEFEGTVTRMEPEKCLGWQWFDIKALPKPLFSPIPSLIEKYPDVFDLLKEEKAIF